MKERLQWAEELAAMATRFSVPNTDDKFSLCVEKRGPNSWVVMDGACVLNKNLAWEFEPIPSSRSAAFVERTRFPLKDAIRIARAIAWERSGSAHKTEKSDDNAKP